MLLARSRKEDFCPWIKKKDKDFKFQISIHDKAYFRCRTSRSPNPTVASFCFRQSAPLHSYHLNLVRCPVSRKTDTMASTLRDDDDEDILDISEQTNRPTDDALHQQRVQAWHPILDPVWVIVGLFYLGVILVPTGTCCDNDNHG